VTSKPAPRVSWVLLVVLVVALATGAAASILVTASTAPPPPSHTVSLVLLPQWVVTAISIGFAALVIGTLVLWGLRSGPSPMLTRMALSVLMVVLLGILFVVGARFLGVGGGIGMSGSGTSTGNNTTLSHNTTPIKGGLNATGNGTIVLFPGLPGWVPFAALGIVVLLIVVVGVPQTRRYLAERSEGGRIRRGSAATVPAGMREALTRASSELDLGGDPRLVILALYAAMLEQLKPMVDDIGTSTPEEIRASHLVRLGVRPEAARTLTRLFEEARYSTHPMGPAESVRAQESVQMALDDLARRTVRE
jgi:hypothetical protein